MTRLLPGRVQSAMDRCPWILPVAIGLLGCSLRLYGLGAQSLWYDEAASLFLGAHATSVADLFDPTYTSEPPLNTIMTSGWVAIVDGLFTLPVTDPRHDFLLRLLPLLFSVAALPLVYLLTLRLFHDRRSACLACFLLAISPFQVYYAQELRVYSIVVVLALLAIWALVEALETGHALAWTGLVFSLALSMYAHFITVWLIFALNVAFVLLLPVVKRHFWPWVVANLVLLVLIAPMLYRALLMNAEVQAIEYPWYPNPTWKTVFITFKTFLAGYTPRVWAYRILFLLAFGLHLNAARSLRTDRIPLTLLFCIAWVPVAGCAFHWGLSRFSFYEHRLFIVSGVATLMLVAHGAARMGRSGFALVAVLTCCTAPCLGDLYAGRIHQNPMHRIALWDKVDFRDASQFLLQQAQPGDRLLYASHFCTYPMFHYYDGPQGRMGWSVDDEQAFIKTMGHEAILRAHRLMPVPREEAVAGASRIWFLSTEGNTFEWQPTTEHLVAWLGENYEPVAFYRWKGVFLRLYTLPGAG